MVDIDRIKIILDKNIHLLKTSDALTVTDINRSLYHPAVTGLNLPLTLSVVLCTGCPQNKGIDEKL